MRVNEKYSTLPAEDRSVHIINICAIEDIGHLPSEGTVSQCGGGGRTGRAPVRRAGWSWRRTDRVGGAGTGVVLRGPNSGW